MANPKCSLGEVIFAASVAEKNASMAKMQSSERGCMGLPRLWPGGHPACNHEGAQAGAAIVSDLRAGFFQGVALRHLAYRRIDYARRTGTIPRFTIPGRWAVGVLGINVVRGNPSENHE